MSLATTCSPFQTTESNASSSKASFGNDRRPDAIAGIRERQSDWDDFSIYGWINNWNRKVEKIELYLETGVAVVWIVDPDLRNVTVYRPGQQEVLFAAAQELIGDPELPGFRVKVAHLFGR